MPFAHMVIVFLSLLSIIAPAIQATDKQEFSYLETLIKDVKERSDMVSGTAVVIVKGDRIVHEGYFGYADVAGQKPVDQDSVFYIASTTKAFLAQAVLMAEERGDLSEATTLQELFPDLTFKAIDAGKITVQHLLSHTSGIDNEPLTWAMSYTGLHGPADHRHQMIAASYPSAGAKLGEFEYSNIGYSIMAVWMDAFYGQDWRMTLRDWILDPLDMDHSSAFISEIEENGWPMVKPYSYKVGGGREALYLRKTDETMHNIGLMATARDTARFIMAQMNDGRIDGKQVFSSAVPQKQRVKQLDVDGPFYDGYAWGWMTGVYEGHTKRFHTGGFAGTSANIGYLPDQKIGIVVLHNENGLKANVLGSIIEKAAYGIALGKSEAEVMELVQKSVDWLVDNSAKAKVKLAAAAKTREEAPWKLSAPFDAYLGTYNHRWGGEITITKNPQGKMALHWGLLKGTGFPGESTDNIVVDFRPGNFDDLSFLVTDGSVTGLSFNGVIFDH